VNCPRLDAPVVVSRLDDVPFTARCVVGVVERTCVGPRGRRRYRRGRVGGGSGSGRTPTPRAGTGVAFRQRVNNAMSDLPPGPPAGPVPSNPDRAGAAPARVPNGDATDVARDVAAHRRLAGRTPEAARLSASDRPVAGALGADPAADAPPADVELAPVTQRRRADDAPPRTLGTAAVAALLVSNMVGTGVFTSLGFQARDLRATPALLLLWLVGGVAALCGALAYAELGAALPRSGGEYVYLGRAYHPLVGFLGGWVSMTAGFAAPIALAGIAFGRYLSAVLPVPALPASLALVGAAALLHASHLTLGRRVQVALTAANLALVAGFVAAGLARGAQPVPVVPNTAAWREALSPAFAVSLVYVSYAYTGWNAAGYVAGEVRDPRRTLPRALAAGAGLVTVLYVLLNYTFLRLVPLGDLAGVVEVGALAARRAFGPAGAAAASATIALLLTATVSAMMLAGSRVTQAVAAGLAATAAAGGGAAGGAAGAVARSVARTAGGAVPRNAVLLQAALVAALLLTNSFERVMAYAGFTLNLMSLLTVGGLFVLRRREPALPRPYRAWGYPVTPLVYVLLSCWTLAFVLAERPGESLLGLATVLAGVPVWAALRGRARAAPGR